MRSGNKAELNMRKPLCKGVDMDQKTYLCSILRYDLAKECIYLVLENDSLKEISLDAIYECMIKETEKETIMCTGRVIERFHEEKGKIIKFKIENGFYKINVKSVDK